MAKIVDTVRDEKIPVIFYEELTEPRTAEIICGETGCAMRLFHSATMSAATNLKRESAIFR